LLFQLPGVPAAKSFRVLLEGEVLTLSADEIPLRTILSELASQGTTVKLDPQINPLVTANYTRRPIEQILGSLLDSASYSLLWESNRDQDGKSKLHLAEIQIFKSGRKDLMKTLSPPKRLNIVKNKDGSLFVKNEILFNLAPGTDLNKLGITLQKYNAVVVESDIPGIVKIIFPNGSDISAITREIRNKHNIISAEPNYAYPINKPVTYSIPLAQTNIDSEFYSPASDRAPIAVLDSGLSTIDVDLEKFVISSLDVMNPDLPISDTMGHGTQMALIASGLVTPYGVEKNQEAYNPIIVIKAFDDNGFTTDFNIMDSIDFALANNAKVLSLSWGTETKSKFMERAFEYARSKGLIIVASAGNEPTGKPVYPAAFPTVIGVGALEPHGKTWENSNYGNFVSLYAPGFANMPVGYKGDPGMYAGTSISAAHVANTIAVYLSENPLATIQQVRQYLNTKY
jgi:subtilisin family serine protease